MSAVTAAQTPPASERSSVEDASLGAARLRPYGARRTFGRAACAAVADLVRLGDVASPALCGLIAALLSGPLGAASPEAVLIPALTSLAAGVALPTPPPPSLGRPGSLAASAFGRTLLGLLTALLISDVLPATPPIGWWARFSAGLITLLGAVRLAGLGLSAWCERTGRFRDVVAVVGSGEAAGALFAALRAAPPAEAEIVGLFKPASVGFEGSESAGEGGAGSLADLVRRAPDLGVTHVILVASEADQEALEAWLHVCLALSVEVCHCAEIDAKAASGPLALSALKARRLSGRPLDLWQRALKRGLDLGLGLLLLVFFSPLMLVAAAAIRLESPGPALFRQRRRGFNNAEILVYKFRTMWVHVEDPAGSRQTEPNDPRVTRIGRFLRASSLDELPQLLNVVRGDMSLVGPRPHPVGMRVEGALCEDAISTYAHRHRVKPGITGLAQVQGSRGPAVEVSALSRRLAYDLDYIEAGSIWLDVKILALTPLRLMTSKAF